MLPVEVLEIAGAVAGADARVLASYRLPPARRSRLRDFVDRFLEYHLEARPRTRRRPRPPRAPLLRR
jgi:hypothetical protein